MFDNVFLEDRVTFDLTNSWQMELDGMMELFEKQKDSSNFKIRQFENFLFRKTI